MLVEERIVEDRPRLDFKYKIQSGPTTIKSYGLALARCLRFPSSLIDKAEEIVDQVLEESLIDISKVKNTQRPNSNDSEAMEIDEANETSNVSQEMDKDVIDLYSYVLLLMNSSSTQNNNVDVVNQKLVNLIDKMSPEFRELIKNSTLEEIISVLNSTRSSED
jgi:DNA mismatch repair ATPase MutS